MFSDIRRAFALIDRADRWRWALLVPLALVVGGLEALGAGAVFVLVRILTDPGQIDRLPSPLNRLPHGGDPRAAVLTLTAYLVVLYIARNATLVAIHAAEESVVHRSADRIASSLLARYLYAPYPFHFHRTTAALVQNLRESVDMVVGLFAYAGFRVVPSINRILLNANSLRYGRAYVEPLVADWLALGDVSTEPPAAGEHDRSRFVAGISWTYGTLRIERANLTPCRAPLSQTCAPPSLSSGILGEVPACSTTRMRSPSMRRRSISLDTKARRCRASSPTSRASRSIV